MGLVNSKRRESKILPFNHSQIFQGVRMTAALRDRLIHHSHNLETNGESYRFKHAIKRSTKIKKN